MAEEYKPKEYPWTPTRDMVHRVTDVWLPAHMQHELASMIDEHVRQRLKAARLLEIGNLKYIAAQCGTPDAIEGCRLILATIQRRLDIIETERMKDEAISEKSE